MREKHGVLIFQEHGKPLPGVDGEPKGSALSNLYSQKSNYEVKKYFGNSVNNNYKKEEK
jgi:hypothetical protein